ncbi:nitrate reductase maturation protein NarM [Synechococcales cyanobacterium C]|uniref:Nitrate reductase maturation protein NarM n=1 Tax=Petrachloros mirabilis ULC683 TaxID=2781853 RepID=A0A8K1ZZ20_9CYAN|nr:nitrate reductase associated protein [Petrachloros mirabilis]NCJ07965.1 nitrate reductase maturation protein NarM [Petrachloros mirabilis ULC683]
MTFQFEADFVDTLRCIPMAVRYKLDTCGIKLKLDQWHQFPFAARQALVEMPCDTTEQDTTEQDTTEQDTTKHIQQYRLYLQDLIWQYSHVKATELPIDPHPPWLDTTQTPTDLNAKAEAAGLSVSLSQWQQLTPLQRFALIKLSRPSHESRNFIPALKEFGLLPAQSA